MSVAEIIELFAFGPEERAFPDIEENARRIEAWLQHNEPTEAQLLRYMLVGLWMEYRATNHHGDTFTTDPSRWRWDHLTPQRERTRRQLAALNARLGRSIKSTQEYLTLLFGCPPDEWGPAESTIFDQGDLFRLVAGDHPAAGPSAGLPGTGI